MRSQLAFPFSFAVLVFASAQVAEAKPARCYTTDDGEYACDFVGTDADGSFEISASGKPTFSLVMDSPGRAYGFADFGTGRSVALPGVYVRNEQDPACWVNDETSARICAW